MKDNQYSPDEQMILAYYGELSDSELQAFQAELTKDASRTAQYEAFKASMSTIKNDSQPEVSEDFFTALEYNIHNAIRKEQHPVTIAEPQKTTWLDSLKEMFLTPQRVGFVLAGGLTFMLLGMFIGTKMQSGQSSQSVASVVDTTSSSTLPASSEKVTDFLKRSQIYLVTSVDNEVKCEKCVPIQEQYNNKKIAADLLKEASQIRQHAKNNPEMQKLLGDLEFVLYNISTNQASVNPAQAEVVHHVASNAVCEATEKLDSAKVILPK
ncbi:MAG: hypothetical protein JNJ85_11830 [Candidatus Kapabacteria bacterium]|nr:hypothetical protein [Candidatus Kapabacteria bacterium]